MLNDDKFQPGDRVFVCISGYEKRYPTLFLPSRFYRYGTINRMSEVSDGTYVWVVMDGYTTLDLFPIDLLFPVK